ncbi:MAG TPA: ABC transporter permease [Acidimicrobiales bacterium]|nr:ABC transporter permease [Acidimicrobiales bacterium]
MRLALREMHRRPGRFAIATVILTLIAILLMFLGGLLDGLVASSTGAFRAQRADLVVYSGNSRNSLERSRIEPDVRHQVESVPGVTRVGGLGSVQLGGRIPGRGARDLVPTVLFGYELAPRGLPSTPPGAGTVYADDSLRAKNVVVGTTIHLGPARSAVTIVGFVSDTRYSGQGTLWGSLETWRQVLDANRPDARVGPGVVQALVVQGVSLGRAGLPEQIDRATDGATTTLTITEAINALPGVSQQRTVFNQIIGVTVVIAIVVVALFFALLTVERTALYGVLKAIGASSRTLFVGVVLQAVVVALIASLIGVVASLVLDALIPAGTIPFVATPARLLSSAVVLVVAAVVGCTFSLRRVLRVDPAAAIGGAP